MKALLFSRSARAAFGWAMLPVANASAQMASPAPTIRDIAPPIDVFPYPAWMVATACGAALLLVLLATWLIVKWLRSRPAALPASPRELALSRLEEARKRIDELDPYEFSILVSDLLREFITAHYDLRATRQTSPEFLESIKSFPDFADANKALLAEFLERCDLIKFARIQATKADSAALLEQASAFVQAEPAPRIEAAAMSNAP